MFVNMETTPKEITKQVMTLCNKINGKKPLYIAVVPQKDAIINECFANVQNIINSNGGKMINGWAIWQMANILVEAEAHAVWKNKDGIVIDITPHINNEKQILFLPDEGVVYEEKNIDNIRIPLTDSPLVKEYIRLSEEKVEILSRYKPHEQIDIYGLPERYFDIEQRIMELSIQFHTKVERNDKCPCGSGIKYKKCCGKY